ncbi:unnamed protein product [Urochloa humidicola]
MEPRAPAGSPQDSVMSNLAWHQFIHCPLNKQPRRSLIQYALTEVLTEAINIPGHGSVSGRRATLQSKVVFRRSFRAMLSLHRAGHSMGGNFTGLNFIIDPQFFVRLHSIHYVDFCHDEGEKDYCQFIWVFLHEVFVRESAPPEVLRWLQLISKGIQGYEYLISYHNSMMEYHQAITSHMSLYMIFLELKRTNRRLYKLIISWLPQYDGWKNGGQYCINALMNRTRRYVNPGGSMTRYQDDIRGVLKLVRNCWQHPCRFLEAVLTLIVAVDFPHLLSDFQEAMFDAAQLGKLNLEVTME